MRVIATPREAGDPQVLLEPSESPTSPGIIRLPELRLTFSGVHDRRWDVLAANCSPANSDGFVWGGWRQAQSERAEDRDVGPTSQKPGR